MSYTETLKTSDDGRYRVVLIADEYAEEPYGAQGRDRAGTGRAKPYARLQPHSRNTHGPLCSDR